MSASIVVAAAISAFCGHVLLQYVQNSIIAERGEELSKMQMLKFPYPWHIDVLGAVTAIVPTLLYYGLLSWYGKSYRGDPGSRRELCLAW